MINMAFMPLYMWEMWDVTPVTHERTHGQVESRAVFSLNWIRNSSRSILKMNVRHGESQRRRGKDEVLDITQSGGWALLNPTIHFANSIKSVNQQNNEWMNKWMHWPPKLHVFSKPAVISEQIYWQIIVALHFPWKVALMFPTRAGHWLEYYGS